MAALGKSDGFASGRNSRIYNYGVIFLGNNAVKISVLTSGAGMNRIAFNNAGGFHNGADFKFVSGCGNNFLLDKYFTADGAMLAFGKTGFGAGRSNRFVNNFGVTGCGNDFLFNEDFTADRAMLAFGKTGFGAGRSNRFVDHFSVTGCRSNFLLNENFTANGAMLAFGKTGFGAGGSNRFVNNFGVTVCRNDFLFNEDFTANGAMFTFGKTGFGAGGSNCFIDYFLVTFCRNFLLSHKNFVADGAVLALGKSGFGTGRINSVVNNNALMRLGYDIVIENISAVFTGVNCIAVCGAGRFYDNNVEFVSCCGNSALFKDFVTNSAFLVFGSAVQAVGSFVNNPFRRSVVDFGDKVVTVAVVTGNTIIFRVSLCCTGGGDSIAFQTNVNVVISFFQ